MNVFDARASLTLFTRKVAMAHGLTNPNILLGTSVAPEDRPSIVVDMLAGGMIDRKASYVECAIQPFIIMYLAKGGFEGHIDAERFVSRFQQELENERWTMQGYLIDFRYPKPAVVAKPVVPSPPTNLVPAPLPVPASSTIAPGDYLIGVSGVNFQETNPDETMVSDLVRVTVAANEYIEVRIPEHPRGIGWFPEYNLYIAPGNDEDLLQRVSAAGTLMKADSIDGILIHNIDAISLSDPVPQAVAPPTRSRVVYRYMDVPEQNFNMGVFDDPSIETGNYIGHINLNLEYPLNVRWDTPASIIQRVGADTTADGVRLFPPQVLAPRIRRR